MPLSFFVRSATPRVRLPVTVVIRDPPILKVRLLAPSRLIELMVVSISAMMFRLLLMVIAPSVRLPIPRVVKSALAAIGLVVTNVPIDLRVLRPASVRVPEPSEPLLPMVRMLPAFRVIPLVAVVPGRERDAFARTLVAPVKSLFAASVTFPRTVSERAPVIALAFAIVRVPPSPLRR